MLRADQKKKKRKQKKSEKSFFSLYFIFTIKKTTPSENRNKCNLKEGLFAEQVKKAEQKKRINAGRWDRKKERKTLKQKTTTTASLFTPPREQAPRPCASCGAPTPPRQPQPQL